MSERVRALALGEEVAISLGFEYEADGEIECVEAAFVREGSDAEIVLLGDARKEASGDRAARYAARLEAKIAPNAEPGEYRAAPASLPTTGSTTIGTSPTSPGWISPFA